MLKFQNFYYKHTNLHYFCSLSSIFLDKYISLARSVFIKSNFKIKGLLNYDFIINSIVNTPIINVNILILFFQKFIVKLFYVC